VNMVRSHVLISIDAGTIMAGARAVEEALVKEIASQGLAEGNSSPGNWKYRNYRPGSSNGSLSRGYLLY